MNTPFLNRLDIVGKWVSPSVINDYLTVQSGEFSMTNVYVNQSLDVHPPLYYWFLHLVTSLFVNQFSVWHGYVLNYVFFLITTIFLYKTADAILKDKILALLPCALFGFISAVPVTVYIRMYSLLTLFAIALIYCVLRIYDSRNVDFFSLLSLMLVIVAGCLTHYYFLIYSFFVVGCFCLYFLFNSDYKKLALFSLSSVVAICIFFIIYPYVFDHLFGGKHMGTASLGNIETTSLNSLKCSLKNSVIMTFAYLFGHIYIAGYYVFLVVLLIFLSICRMNVKRWLPKFSMKHQRIAAIFVVCSVAAFLTCFFVYHIAVYKSSRYIFFCSPLLSILFTMVVVVLVRFIAPRKFKLASAFIIISVIFLSCLKLNKGALEYPRQNLNNEYLSGYKDGNVIIVLDRERGFNPTITQVGLELMHCKSFYIVYADQENEFAEILESCGDNNIHLYVSSYCEEYEDTILPSFGVAPVDITYDSGFGHFYRIR